MSRPPIELSSRRRFLRAAGLVGLGAAVSANRVAFAQSRSGTAAPAPPDTSKAPAGPPPPSEDARALAAILERRYGKHLSPVQLEAVATELEGRLQGGQRLRQSRLANGDEPDFVFGAE